MATKPSNKLAHAGFFGLRTPLLPFAELLALGDGIAGRTDVGALRARLRAIVERPAVHEAIAVASPSLAAEIDAWLTDPASDRGQKVERGLVRYVSRMCGRATPFGQFAGCSVGLIGDATSLVVTGSPRTHSRLDMAYIGALADDLLRLPEVRASVTYRPNTSLYAIADQVRYFEYTADAKRHRVYGLVSVPATDYLDVVLERAAPGARFGELVDAVTAALDDVPSDEVADYITQLVDNQVLVAEFPPCITGPEPLPELIARTGALEATRPVAAALREVEGLLGEIDALPLGTRGGRYRDIATRLSALPTSFDATRLVQVDMVKPGLDARLGPEVVAEVTRAMELLHKLGPTANDHPLHELAARFAKRYEGREVRLVEALDEEWGIAPPYADPSPLLDELPFEQAPGGREPMRDLHAMLLREIHDLARRDGHVLVLSEEQLRPYFTAAPAPLWSAFSVMATVAAGSNEAIARGEFYVVIEGVKGPSGASLLGRFCHADPELRRRVADYVRLEEHDHPDAIYAEIVHQPQHRVGNILARPVLRDHEIVYLGQSGAPLERQIAISDLLVSVVDGRFVLRSERLGKRVIPRLTNAHTLLGGLTAYRFLGQLASDPALVLGMGPLDALPFTPRIVVGRAVLHLARWRVSRSELEALDRPSAAERFAAVDKLRSARRLPRIFAVQDLDNELPIDLDNALSVESFVHLVKNRRSVTLVEMFPAADELCAEGPGGRFVHELVIPFCVAQPAPARASIPPRPGPAVARRFGPGSEWLYVKLYSGASAADRILREVVDPVLEELAGVQWFFLRYADPDTHLRVRFHGDPAVLRHDVYPRLCDASAELLEAGLVQRVQLDTYERELERYGGDDGIALAEQLFHADSAAVLAIVRDLDHTTELDARWRFTLAGIDRLLGDLGLDLRTRHEVIRAQRAGFGAEFRVGTLFERGLGQKFRKERTRIDAVLDPAQEPALHAVLDQRSAQLAPIAGQLAALDREGRLTVQVPELAKSFIHMHANRLLRSATRAQELVLYDFLERIYTSRIARGKTGG
jgi:thiopeptide-type bacteriocin biosynthesis protein